MQKRALGKTGLEIAPLVFGGNVFGWTIDEKQSFAVLDAFVDHGFNAIDTADVYSTWAPGNKGGESETIIGRWLKANPAKRDKVTIFTKVGARMKPEMRNGDLSAGWIAEEVEHSLARLGVERIDLYFSHVPDGETPQAETLGAYDRLIKAGKVASIGASNFDASQLEEAQQISESQNLPAYQVLQPEYNVYDRASFDGPLKDFCVRNGLGVVTYFSLASGFLSGKYRSQTDLSKSQRGEDVGRYLDGRGLTILDALDRVSARHGAKQAEVALAWLMAAPGVTAPIASATSTAHVESFARAAALSLSDEDMAELDRASA